MIMELKGNRPVIGEGSFIAETAMIIGSVEIGRESCVWFGAVVRGDIAPIKIGDNTNVQDNAVVHVSRQIPTEIGNHVTVGHGVILHGCTVGDNCLVGMNSVLMDGVRIGKNTIIGAGSLVGKGKTIPEGVLVMGSPARVVRELTPEEIKGITSYGDRNYDNARENYL